MPIDHSNILLLGLLLLSGLFAGQLANKAGIPRVAAYVLVGTLFSPDLLGQFIQTSSIEWAQPLTHIPLGVIAFIIGGSITTPQLQRMGKSMISIAIGESMGAILAVFSGLLLFFTLAGTHFHINVFLQHIDLIFMYFFARIVGKIIGAGFGAKITRSPIQITRWLGFALIPQAGVAIGLALTLSHHVEFKDISVIILNVILATTLIYELIGPLAARFALQKAGEITASKTHQ